MPDPSRQLRGRLGAFISHARNDPRTQTKNARASFLERFEREADPDGTLPPAERARRAAMLRSAHFTRLALASLNARRAKALKRAKTRAGVQPVRAK
jgi:hypothetical protein